MHRSKVGRAHEKHVSPENGWQSAAADQLEYPRAVAAAHGRCLCNGKVFFGVHAVILPDRGERRQDEKPPPDHDIRRGRRDLAQEIRAALVPGGMPNSNPSTLFSRCRASLLSSAAISKYPHTPGMKNR